MTIAAINNSDLTWNVGNVLETLGLTRSALNCLDVDDQLQLQSALDVAGRLGYWDYQHRTALLQDALREWLRDWADSGQRDLHILVEEVRSMCGCPFKTVESVNWIEDGF